MRRNILVGLLRAISRLSWQCARTRPSNKLAFWPSSSQTPKLRKRQLGSGERSYADQRVGSASVDRQNPYLYTSGRWLRNDPLERGSRSISFDFDALCRRVVQLSPGAASIASYRKIEGGFNRVFVFTTDNGTRVVAKLPFSVAGPPRLTTNSEVATIRYLQANTCIPIPRILDWSEDPANHIGSEYVIMEHARGVQLLQIWPSMTGRQRIDCINAILKELKDMADIEFSTYGSLYFTDGPIKDNISLPIIERYCIGPHCGSIYWNSSVDDARYYHEAEPNRGPWSTLTAYGDGLIDTGLSRVPPVDSVPQKRSRYRGSPKAHHQLLESGRAVIRRLCNDPQILKAGVPTLFHPDLHKRNIFVSEGDPTVVTDFIDWQSSSIEPAFWYTDWVPDFVEPDTNCSPDDRLQSENAELCKSAFNLCTQYHLPKLAAPRSMNDNLFRPFRYCHRTWNDGAVAFCHELMETSRCWEELGLSGSCPFPLPTPEELAVHGKEYRLFEAAQNLKRDLSNLLKCATDGWVPPEEWEVTQSAHKEVFDGMLVAVLSNEEPDDDEPIRSEADLREIWPFDL